MPVIIIFIAGGVFLSIFLLLYFQLQDIRQLDEQIHLAENELTELCYETEVIPKPKE